MAANGTNVNRTDDPPSRKFLVHAETDDPLRTPRIGYASYTMTCPPPERIISLMKKLVDVVLDWLWDRLTYVVMSQGR